MERKPVMLREILEFCKFAVHRDYTNKLDFLTYFHPEAMFVVVQTSFAVDFVGKNALKGPHFEMACKRAECCREVLDELCDE